MKMKLFLILCLVFALTCASCAPSAPDVPDDFDDTTTAETHDTEPPETTPVETAQTISFTLDDDRTFSVAVELPDGWSVLPGDTENLDDDAAHLCNTVQKYRQYFADADGTVVGAIAMTPYTVYAGSENSPKAIYVKVTLGNDYCFYIYDNNIHPVGDHSVGATYRCPVVLSAVFRQPWSDTGEKTNYGILSHNSYECVYVAIELDSVYVTEECADEIAASLTWE